MLEQLRRNSRSWLIWFIFAIIIAAFVLFFGPQSGPEMFGCAGSAQVAEVDGEEIEPGSWRFAMNTLGGTSGGSTEAARRRVEAIDKLVERQILVTEAERLGMKVSEDLVLDNIKIGKVTLLGYQVDGKNIFFKDGLFNYKYLDLWVKNSGLPSVDAFVAEQKKEILANLVRDVLMRSSATSLEEARSEYIDRNTQITLDYVVFPVAKYAAALELSERDAATYAAAHEEAVKAAWEAEKAQFADDKERVLARVIIINKAAPSIPPADGDEAAVPDPSGDEAKKKAEAALVRVTGGEDFGALAAELSDDTRTKRRGGLLGWRSADALGYGTAVVDAVKTLEPGQTSQVIDGPRGYHIIKLEARTDKALGYEQRAPDIAYRLAAIYFAEKLAARDAKQALAKSEGKALADVFERQYTPEQLQMIQEQLEKLKNQMPPPTDEPLPDEQGFFWREGEIVPAQVGAAPAAATGPSAEPAPSGELLPDAEVEAAMVEKLGPLSRQGDKLAGIGRSKELMRDLFENLDEGQIGAKVYSVTDPDGLVIVQLLDRSEADLEKFAAEADEARDQMAASEGVLIVHSFIERRCRELATAGEIGVNNSYLIYDEDKPPVAYTACSTLNERDVLGRLASHYPVLAPLMFGF